MTTIRASPSRQSSSAAATVAASASVASSTSTTRAPGKNPTAFTASESSAGSRRRSPAGDPRQPHLGRALGTDQRLDQRGALQRHPHGVGAEEKHARRRRIGPREETRRLAPGELHVQSPAASASRCRMRSARSIARRRSASSCAAWLAKAEAAGRFRRTVAGDRAHHAAGRRGPAVERHQRVAGGPDHVEAGGDVLLGQRHAGAGEPEIDVQPVGRRDRRPEPAGQRARAARSRVPPSMIADLDAARPCGWPARPGRRAA